MRNHKLINIINTIVASASVGLFFVIAGIALNAPWLGLVAFIASLALAFSGKMPVAAGAGLSHYRNSAAAMNNYEPIFLNQWEVTLTPPVGINAGVGNNGQNLLLEQVKKVSGLEVDKNPGVVEQYYKFAKRRYAGARPETTTVDITIDFEVNLNNANSAYTFSTIRQWSDLIYNPNTGAMGLKTNYVGSGLITEFNKAGDIWRMIRLPAIWPMTPINALELEYQSTDVWVMSMTFAADYWEDTWI